MNNYQSRNKRKRYFEGWYFKHQKGNRIIALIPGISMDTNERNYAFIQIITNENSYCIHYSMNDCIIANDRLFLKIGDNIFCRKGIKIDIDTKEICLKGIIRYGALTPIRYPIMGVFQYLPRMECKHAIISMNHKLKGSLILNDKAISFDNGIGYMEKDWGHSFPKSYLWLQCNSFLDDRCSIVVSIADIPYLGQNFEGCICVIHYKGIEYRLASYLGVRVITFNRKEICLRQGRYLLKILYKEVLQPDLKTEPTAEISSGFSHKLLAPSKGDMSRTIQEQHACQARYEFYEGKRLIFALSSNEASLEIVK